MNNKPTRKPRRSAAAAVLALLLLVNASGQAAQRDQHLFVGGPVITLDADGTIAEAVLTDGDRIIAVGSADTVRAVADGAARVIDLDGQTLLPGFIDAHGHFPFGKVASGHSGQWPNRWGARLIDLSSPPIGEVESIDDIVKRLAAKAAKTPDGDWIQGIGYDDTLLAEARHPTRRDLDRASRTHPIYLLHVSGHVAAANSLALSLAGIDADTPQPDGGHIYMDEASGEPTGVLEELSAMSPVNQLTPPVEPAELIDAAQANGMAYATVGVTSAQMGAADIAAADTMIAAWREGRLPIRVQVWPVMFAVLDKLAHDEALPELPDTKHYVSYGALKGFADGSIQAYTGYLGAPYHRHEKSDPDYRGYPSMPAQDLARIVGVLHAAGYQLAIHGNGDAAINDILDALESAETAAPRDDSRHVVVHAQMATDGQLDRMARLDVIPSFFNLHTYYWGDRHRDIFLGPTRAASISPARSAAERNLRFTLHADSPVVPMDPMLMVWTAVNRQTLSGQVLGANETITVEQALRALTIDAARQGFEEDLKGSIEPGKLADLVVVDRNPLIAPPQEIRAIRAMQTWVGGQRVFNRND